MVSAMRTWCFPQDRLATSEALAEMVLSDRRKCAWFTAGVGGSL